MRTIVSILLLVAFSTFVNAQSWNIYKDKSASFSISLPAVPTVTESTTSTGSSRTVKADYDDYTNIVSVYNNTGGFAGDPFSLSAEMIMAGMDPAAKLVQKSDLIINGKKGLRALFFIPTQNFYIEKGVVVDGKYAYSILQIRSNKDDKAVADQMFASINK